MKKALFLIITIALSGALTFHFIHYQNANTLTPEEQALLAPHPGYGAQWRMMKENAQGEIPSGLYSKWYNYDLQQRSMKRALDNPLRSVKFIGPNQVGGRTRDLMIDAANHDRVIACGISGGIWESYDKGLSWAPHDDLSPNLNVTCIEQDPFNHQVIYYGTGEGAGNSSDAPGEGIFKSTDGGKTYTQLQATLDLIDENEMESIWDIKHSPKERGTFYVSCRRGGAWRSTDSGATFQNIFPYNQDIHDIEVFPDGSVMLAVESRGVMYSATGDSASFRLLDKGIPTSGFNRIEVTYSKAFPDVVYAQLCRGVSGYDGESVGVYKSSNKGRTWTEVRNPENYGGRYGFTWYTLALQISPTDTNFLVTGSINMLYSRDGGQTWGRAENGHADHHEFIFWPDDPDKLFACNDGGIYQYDVSTIRYRATDRNQGYNVTQFYAGSHGPDSLMVIGGTQDNGTFHEFNGNPEFDHILGGDGAFCYISQQNPFVGYASSQNGNIRRTLDLGSPNPSFTNIRNDLDDNFDGNIDDGAWFINPFEVNPLDHDELYFPTRRRVWVSYNAGDKWHPLTNMRLNFYAIGIPNEANPKSLYAGGDDMLLVRIDNPQSEAGAEETYLRGNRPAGLLRGFISSIKVHPNNSSIIYLSLSNYDTDSRVWRVSKADTDEPEWTNLGANLPEQLACNWLEVDPYNPDSVLFAATDFGLYVTQDAGQTWVKETRIPNVAIHQLRLRPTDRKLFIFTHGRGIWAADLKASPDYLAKRENVQSLHVQVYPNPAQNNIQFTELPPGNWQYLITNLEGQLVKSGQTQATNSLDVADLASGQYLISLRQQQTVYRAKWIKN